MSLSQKDKLDYAWGWFAYHAGQRLTAFNFLLVLSGALAVALSKAFELGMYEFSAIVGFFGTFAALGFLILDWRNKDLVELGHVALRSIEGTEDSSETPAAWQLSRKDDVKRRQSPYKTHTVWLRAIAILLLILFAVATIVSALKIAEEHCRKKTARSKVEAYYQCPTLNKKDATQFWREQNHRTRENSISQSAS